MPRLLTATAQRLGIREPWLTPHAFRHSHATEMWDGGMREMPLQKRLGHASPDSTSIYTRVTAVPGVRHAHARARWTGRTLRVEVEGWVDAETTVAQSDSLGQRVADQLSSQIPDIRSFTWTTRGI